MKCGCNRQTSRQERGCKRLSTARGTQQDEFRRHADAAGPWRPNGRRQPDGRCHRRLDAAADARAGRGVGGNSASAIADAITTALEPLGVAVLIDAEHQCMTTRGVGHRHVTTVTTRFTGAFKTDTALQDRFLKLCGKA